MRVRSPRPLRRPAAPVGTGVARSGVLLAYFFNGLALSSWSVRLPSIRSELGLTAADLGVFLTAGAIGTLVTVTIAGAVVMRFGPRVSYRIATAVFVLGYLLLGLAPTVGSFPLLLAANVVHGAAFALTNVPQSILAAGSERRVGRTILPQFHASYSIGSAAGAALGGASAALGVAVLPQFIVLAVIALVVRSTVDRLVSTLAVSLRAEALEVSAGAVASVTAGVPVVGGAAGRATDARGAARRGSRGRGILAVWADPQVLLLGVVVFGAALSEGTANNWVSLAVVDTFAAAESDGALTLSVFLVAQTVVRLIGGPVIDRFGRLAVLRASAVASLLGLAVFALAPGFAVAIVGVAIWGAGSALNVPIGIAIAAADPVNGPARVAAVTSLSSIANIAGPPVIGVFGELVGLRTAMASIGVVILGALLGAGYAVRGRGARVSNR